MPYMSQTTIQIQPITHPLTVSVRVPGSKSLTNRSLLVAALADGTTRLTNALFSDDSRYFVESLRRLGFNVLLEPGSDRQRLSPTITVTGLGGRIPAAHADLFIGNAGTAARFLTAMLTLGNGIYTLDGDARMRQRPMLELVTALEQLGARLTRPEPKEILNHTSTPTASLPFTVQARGLRGGHAEVAGESSSQFLSGLLMASPYAEHPVELDVVGGLSSKPFVDMTLAVMADFGVHVDRDGYDRFFVTPQVYHSPENYPIECDATAASYFFAAAAVCGGTVQVEGITRPSKQGDLAFLDVLSQMGCSIADGPGWVSVATSPGGSSFPALRGVAVDMRDMSDTAQTLAAVAPFASTPTTIHGIASSRVKETDRVAAICAELTRLGVRVDEHPDGLTIYPCHGFRPAEIQTYHDHRMAMAFSLIGLKIPGITILDPGCVSKTFPGFFDVLARLQA